jgi:hypothetical protein
MPVATPQDHAKDGDDGPAFTMMADSARQGGFCGRKEPPQPGDPW